MLILAPWVWEGKEVDISLEQSVCTQLHCIKVYPDGNGAKYRYVALIEFRSADIPLQIVKAWPDVLAGLCRIGQLGNYFSYCGG